LAALTWNVLVTSRAQAVAASSAVHSTCDILARGGRIASLARPPLACRDVCRIQQQTAQETHSRRPTQLTEGLCTSPKPSPEMRLHAKPCVVSWMCCACSCQLHQLRQLPAAPAAAAASCTSCGSCQLHQLRQLQCCTSCKQSTSTQQSKQQCQTQLKACSLTNAADSVVGVECAFSSAGAQPAIRVIEVHPSAAARSLHPTLVPVQANASHASMSADHQRQQQQQHQHLRSRGTSH
jgi:hypothetical protein